MKSSHSQFHNNSVWDFHANIGVLVPGQSWGTRVTHWQYYVSGLDCGTVARKTDGSVKLHIFILAYAPCEVVLFLTRTKFKNTSVSFMVLTIFHLCNYWIYMFKMKMSLEEMSWLWADRSMILRCVLTLPVAFLSIPRKRPEINNLNISVYLWDNKS